MLKETAPYAYISLPVSSPADILEEIYNDLNSYISVSWWIRGTKYEQSIMDNASIFIFMQPLNRFKFTPHSLPPGVRREFYSAIRQKKSIYLAYRRLSDDKIGFYAISIRSNEHNHVYEVQGCIGTSDKIYTECKSLQKSYREKWKVQKAYPVNISGDKRILLSSL